MLKCTECVHENICKYKEESAKLFKEIQAIKIPEFLLFNIDCKYYQRVETVKAPINPINQPGYGISSSDPCASCDFYKSTILTGKLYIGDSPCQWCPNSKRNFTCYDNEVTTKSITE